MRLIILILLTIGVALLQATVFPQLRIAGIFPNVVLVFVIIISLIFNQQQAVYSALAGGLTLDFFSVWPFGILSLTLLVMASLLNLAKFYLFARPNFLVILIAIFLGTIFYNFFSALLVNIAVLVRLSDTAVSFGYILPRFLLLEIIYNTAAGAVIFSLVSLSAKTARVSGTESFRRT